MGAAKTKLAATRRELYRALPKSTKNQLRVAEERVQMTQPPRNQEEPRTVKEEWPSYYTVSNVSNLEPSKVKRRKTMKQLQQECSPEFKEFESAVDWKSLDEDTALDLWEDIFKPLKSFNFADIRD